MANIKDLLSKPVGELLKGEDLWLPKDVNSIKAWFDAEKIEYELVEEQHGDHVHTLLKLKNIKDEHQDWARTYALSLIAMKYYIVRGIEE